MPLASLRASLDPGDPSVAARHRWYPRSFRHASGNRLIAHLADGLPTWADKDQARPLDRLGEAGILREKAVAGMDRVGAGSSRCRKDGVGVEVGLGRLGGADLNRLVGQFDGKHVVIGLAHHLDGRDPEITGGMDDPHGNLAPIGDQ